MVPREWGEIQELEKACWNVYAEQFYPQAKSAVIGTFALIWTISFRIVLFYLLPWCIRITYTLTSFSLSLALSLLTGGLMYFVRGTGIATEFKDQYVTHGITQFPRWRISKYLTMRCSFARWLIRTHRRESAMRRHRRRVARVLFPF